MYRQPLDKPNPIYTVALIRTVGLRNLAFIIPSTSIISNISKTMMFIDLIDENTEIIQYLWLRLSKRI